MDFPTRDRYRQSIEEIARRSGQTEEKVAQGAIDLATRVTRTTVEDMRRIHVGTYLIGEGRRELDRLIHCHEAPRLRLLLWAYRHHTAVYFLGLGLFTAIFTSLIVLLGLREDTHQMRILVTLLSLFPSASSPSRW